MIKTINSAMFSKMVTMASRLLEINRDRIDAMNVFPVPDGDTGTNMSMTMQSAVKELKALKTNRISEMTDAISKGALRGARGNSGVILSQVLSGICKTLRDVQEIDTKTFAKGMKNATQVAYGAVSKPKEGTMLTVCRLMSEFASSSRAKNFEDFFKGVLDAGDKALASTPELLPVLKKAGVVDSGGMGLMTVFKGMNMAILGEEIQGGEIVEEEKPKESFSDDDHIDIFNLGNIEFGYCTEFFIINLKRRTTIADIDKLREYLMSIGDCVLVVGDLSFVKVHVHTNDPGKALTHALALGELDRVKIENMLEQNRELLRKYEAEKKPMGMLAISQGEGLSGIFKDLLVDKIIEGGQTMNPSASDIANAAQRINAENIFVFPNNKNIILAAEQSKQLVENKKIHVVPTKNVPQGFVAALAFDPDVSAEENLINMIHAIDSVTVGQVTYAVRTTNIDGFNLEKGDIIALDNKKILNKGSDIATVTSDLVAKLVDSSHEVLNLYYGSDVKEEDAEALCEKLRKAYPDLEVEAYFGGQPIYYYIISLE
ncbi:MAG TPA: dihydroxyacetone kinase [Clostridiales bacterium]|nr:dihydroxyacetone kinase [Clostridiales bacterium]